MNKKEFKPDHAAKTIFAAFGLSEEQYDKLLHDAIEAYNKDKVSQSSSIESAAKVVRAGFIGDEEKLSQYELVLANNFFEMGKKQIKSHIDRLLDSAKNSGMPIVLAGPAIIAGLIDILTDGEGGHECKKCGKCGKKFDEQGNEIKG